MATSRTDTTVPLDVEDPAPTAAPVPPRGTRRPATFDTLRKKRRREGPVVVHTNDDDGEPVELVLRYRALGGKAYDRLVEEHPPTQKQREQGAIYNVDTFAPALIARCCIDPVLSVEQAQELYDSEEWSAGETGGLFIEALRICNAGLDVPFTDRG